MLIYSRLASHSGLWGQVLGREQIGPIYVSALSSGVRVWKLKFLILRSFFLFGHVFLLDVLASVFGLGKRELGALSCAICCVEAARREAVQFGGCHYFDRISLFVYQMVL